MGEVFSRVLEMSLYGSIAILAVLLFRLIFRKCPKKILILFWIVVAARLLCPVNFNSPTSVLNVRTLFPSRAETAVTEAYEPDTTVQVASVPGNVPAVTGDFVPADADAVTSPANVEAVKESGTSRVSFYFVASIIWIAVTGGLIIFSVIRYAIFYSKAKWSSRSYDGRYYMANDIDSPFVVGIFSPKIFFPFHMDDDEREYVLNHEWIHIKNKDSLIKLIGYFILCIHWFNPLVWLAFVMLCADIEMRVDEETTSNFDVSMIKEYCKSLVRHASDDKGGAFMQSTAFSGLGFGGMETKMRITNLLKKQETSLGFRLVALLCTIPVVILVSASSLDHKDAWFEKKPVIPEESAEESEAVETSETPAVYEWDSGYVSYYADIICQCENSGFLYHYSLCYMDDDLIPELVTDNLEAQHHEYGDEVSVYTFRDGKVRKVIDEYYYDVIGSSYYYYLPNCDFICNVVTESDNADYYYVYTLDGILSGSDPVITGKIKNGAYFVDGNEVTEKEFTSTLRTTASVVVGGEYSADKILEILGISGDADADGIPGATDNTDVTASASSSYDPKNDPVYGENDAGPDMSGYSDRTFDNLPNGTILTFDMDDNMDYVLEGNYGKVIFRRLAGRLMISVNGHEYTEEVDYRSCLQPYLFKYYGQVYIYWQIYDGEYWNIRVYALSDYAAVYSGTKEKIRLDYFENTEYFMCEEQYGNDAICSIHRGYWVSYSGGLPQPKADWCYFGEYDRVRVKNDMTGLIVGEEGIATDMAMTIHGGDEIYLIASTAGPDYGTLDVKTLDGTRIRIDISDAYELCYARDNERWLYVYLLTKFERP